ncbi:MAG: hypothetical protein RDU24_08950 [Humidesulfovibrio sp.]|uniref:hypothetical protein n=1 Tax=Humidesulfovibrio sp. TaxID=2910988 RepID=UPI0027F95672|nr:hypothetical protein [Humidesulfovibrio sp.]MDQ7835496.1 hypothetical protein [Humidesulfovibrio sp.]
MSGKTCSECLRPLPDGGYNRKTCSIACANAREARMIREKRERGKRNCTKLCIICGREFEPRNSQQGVCPDEACRLEHRKNMQRRNYRSHKQREAVEQKPQMFVGDPWDTEQPVYILGDMQIPSHHVYLGTDPLPSESWPSRFPSIPFKPARIKGVYVPEAKK